MDIQHNPTLLWACDYLSMLWLEIIHVSKRDPRPQCVNGSISFKIHCVGYNTLREFPRRQAVMNIKFKLPSIFIEVLIFSGVLIISFYRLFYNLMLYKEWPYTSRCKPNKWYDTLPTKYEISRKHQGNTRIWHLMCWKWLGTNHKQILWILMQLPHAALWTKKAVCNVCK